MNLSFNQTNLPAAQARTGVPAAADAAVPGGAPMAGADARQPAAGEAQATPAQPALAFAEWLGLELAVAPAADDAALDAARDTALPGAEAAIEEQQPDAGTPALGAMAMGLPLMPVAQATLAAVVAALPGMPAARDAVPAADAAPAPAALPVRRADMVLPPTVAAAPVVASAPVAAASPGAASAPVVAAAETLAPLPDAAQEQAAPATERGAAHTAGIAAPAPGNAQRTADSVTLSGPPTAWRQTLQEALGDRLQLQLGKNAEQAVIRLEPPMLGRVEIAIRHSAGALEVHISATHGEVLRQLQAVGENLRNDLAQRQFTDVAVNIAQAPRAAAGNMNLFAGDGGGRGRQQDGGQEEQHPGNALAEANTGAAPFSLNAAGKRRA